MGKRFFVGLATILLMVFLQTGLAHASVNDFTIKDFQADYYLDKDNEGRSTLKTVEAITAEFPEFDQNHGIERAIPKSYDNHSTSLKIQSVTGNNGANLSYTTYDSNDNTVLRVGDANTYVHGLNIYKIIYTQRDVTRFFADTNDDEFYWDINGTEWSQPFDTITVHLHVASGLLDTLTKNQTCYYGVSGSNKKCEITQSSDIFTANATKLAAGENLTIAVGFKPHTFNKYVISAAEKREKEIGEVIAILFALSYILTPILLIIMYILKITKGKGAPGKGTIVAEYLPPKGVDVALSSVIMNKQRTWTAATFIDLAVRHKMKIIEKKEDGILKKTTYSLEFISSNGLTDTENEVITALFGDNPKKGTKHDLETNNTELKFAKSLTETYRQVKTYAKVNGYYETNVKLKITMITLIIIIAIMIIATFVFGVIAFVIGILIIVATKPLSSKGRELFDYLKGLELYIKIAEEDRIKVLQSPQGTEKTTVDTNDQTMLLHLYERVLPYAILFGNEKEWAKALGEFYEQQNTQPGWYAGNDVFNAVAFSSALSSFSSTAISSSTYTTSSNSSSGGSFGGGFSGGGGGGGGGGGW
jgi:uncharacterized membrane protein YgcG